MAALHGDPFEYDLEGVYRLVGIELPSLRRAEVEALTGVDSERSVRWWWAMGFPEVTLGKTAFGTGRAHPGKSRTTCQSETPHLGDDQRGGPLGYWAGESVSGGREPRQPRTSAASQSLAGTHAA